MQDFLNFLISEYGKSASELSKTDNGNVLVNNQTNMISLDDMAKKLTEFNNKFQDTLATCDALHIVVKNNQIKLFFIEFKNKDFNSEFDRLNEKYGLKNLILELQDENIRQDFLKFHKNLTDKSILRLRMKPYDSLSLIYFFMETYFENESKHECIDKLFNIEKYFVLVSKTQTEVNPLFKNKSNRNNNFIRPLRFLKRLVPYYYDNVLTLPNHKFNTLINNLNK